MRYSVKRKWYNGKSKKAEGEERQRLIEKYRKFASKF